MNNNSPYDLLVLGAGPGGYVAAIRASQLGMKVAVVERDRPGGLCLNWGCIPTKALLKSAEIYEYISKGNAFGLKSDGVGYDLEEIVNRSRKISDQIVKGVQFLFKKHKIDFIPGTGKITSENEVLVQSEEDAQTLQAKNILLATGARPRDLPGIQRDGERIISSKEAMLLKELPQRLVVVGAGAIGMEFAYYFRCLGSEVTVLEAMEQAMPVEDAEIAKLVSRSFAKRKIKIETHAKVETVERNDQEVVVKYEAKGKKNELTADIALMAIGVTGNMENLGLENMNITCERGRIPVNEHMQTRVPSIFAIGDVIGPPWLAHVASAEGIHAVEFMADENPKPIEYHTIPGCVYCRPQVASVGYTEEKAKEQGVNYTVGSYSFKANGRAVATGDTDGMVKMLFNKENSQLIGAHIVGGEATEMIHELVVAMRMGATAEDIGHSVHAHPTLGESIMEAALDTLGERIHGA